MKVKIEFDIDEQYIDTIKHLVEGVVDVLESGAKKHGSLNYLEKNGSSCSRRDMYASSTRHAAAEYMGQFIDPDSGLPHAAHQATRASIRLHRANLGLRHMDDSPVFLAELDRDNEKE